MLTITMPLVWSFRTARASQPHSMSSSDKYPRCRPSPRPRTVQPTDIHPKRYTRTRSTRLPVHPSNQAAEMVASCMCCSSANHLWTSDRSIGGECLAWTLPQQVSLIWWARHGSNILRSPTIWLKQ